MDSSAPGTALDEFAPELPRPGIACTLIKITGSAPQRVGAKMWVCPDSFYGTLGGGKFEFEVLQHAREVLSAGDTEAHIKEYVLCKEMGQCCGGRVEVFFDPMPRRKTLHLFGAGHVGRATAQVLSGMPFPVILVDPRPEWGQPQGLPPDIRVLCADPVRYIQSRIWSPDDAACVFTHSHDLDFLLIEKLLRLPLGYLGLIGSEHKAEVFKARLKKNKSGPEAEALEDLWESRMHCPIGLALPGKNPKAIAIAIAAELLRGWALAPDSSAPALDPSRLAGQPHAPSLEP